MARSGGELLPYSWKIDLEAGRAHVRGWGPMDISEALEAPRKLVEHPDFRPSHSVLVDLREMLLEPVADELVAMGRTLADLRDRLQGRVAVVVQKEYATAAEMSAAMAASGGSENIRVYTDPSHAEGWLSGDED